MAALYVVGYVFIGFISAGFMLSTSDDPDMFEPAMAAVVFWPIFLTIAIGFVVGKLAKSIFQTK
jgi:hypothetical protein